MKLKALSANAHVLSLANSGEVLFSYGTPVAISVPHSFDGVMCGVYKTAQFHSKTTSKWINVYTATTQTLPQEVLEQVAERMVGVAKR